MTFLKNLLELAGIVFLRFRLIPRVWCVWLVGVNAACLLFINHIEAQVVLAVTLIAVATQTVIYGKTGFTRVLGATHVLWLPMFAWMAMRVDLIASEPELARWIVVLALTNATSLVIDTVEFTRFLQGDRKPSYQWHQMAAA